VRNREIEGSTMSVTLTCRSETHAKHAFCLGKTGTAPPTPDLSVPDYYAPAIAYAETAGNATTADSATTDTAQTALTADQLGGVYSKEDVADLIARVKVLEAAAA
jgi:hypothetical protein